MSESRSVLSDSLWPQGLSITVPRILQARILEWVVIPFSKGSSQPRVEYLMKERCVKIGLKCLSLNVYVYVCLPRLLSSVSWFLSMYLEWIHFFLFFFVKLKLTGVRSTFTLNFEDFAILHFFFWYLRRNDKKTTLHCFILKVILCYQLKQDPASFRMVNVATKQRQIYTIVES